MKSFIQKSQAVLVAAAVLLAASFPALAAARPWHSQRGAAQIGFITTLDSATASFTLSTPTSVTVVVPTSTPILSPNGGALSFGDLFTGNQVRASGSFNAGTKTITASLVQVLAFQAPSVPLTLSGQLKAISATTAPATLVVTVTKSAPQVPGTLRSAPAANQDVTVAVGFDTVVFDKYGEKRTLADLTLGDHLSIWGWLENNGTVTAGTVQDLSVHLMSAYDTGTVTSLNPGLKTLTLDTGPITYTVKTDSATAFVIPLDSTPEFADLAAGDAVDVYGLINDQAKTIQATFVRLNE